MNKTPKIPAGQPTWIKDQIRYQGRGVLPLTDPSAPPAGTLYAGGTPTVSIPRAAALAAVGLAVGGALLLGFVLGAVGAENEPNKGAASVSYTAPSNPQDDQRGPLRQPNKAEMNAYGQALETTYGTCSLEWHGDQGGSWESTCKGPNSK